MNTRRNGVTFLLGITTLVAAAGCASGSYQFGRGWHNAQAATCAPPLADAEVQIAEGRPNKFVDGVGWVLGVPGKVLLWDRRVNNHRVTSDTTVAVADYIEQNQLQDVLVRVNQYAPREEWRRLRANREVGAGWRYTLGTLSLVGYTLLPGRLIGGDLYNPYTNSVYVYSDVPALAMQATAYAKDVHRRDYPGTYAAINELPGLTMWHETIATRDALDYLAATGDYDEQVEGVRILYPYYGLRVGNSVGSFVSLGVIPEVAGALVGHLSGQIELRRLSPPAETAGTWVELDDEDSIRMAADGHSAESILRGQPPE